MVLDNATTDEAREALDKAYPFGCRSEPYTSIWADRWGDSLLDTIHALRAEVAKLKSDNERLTAFRDEIVRLRKAYTMACPVGAIEAVERILERNGCVGAQAVGGSP